MDVLGVVQDVAFPFCSSIVCDNLIVYWIRQESMPTSLRIPLKAMTNCCLVSGRPSSNLKKVPPPVPRTVIYARIAATGHRQPPAYDNADSLSERVCLGLFQADLYK